MTFLTVYFIVSLWVPDFRENRQQEEPIGSGETTPGDEVESRHVMEPGSCHSRQPLRKPPFCIERTRRYSSASSHVSWHGISLLRPTSGREASTSVLGGFVTGAHGRRDWLQPQASIGLGSRKRGCRVGQRAFLRFRTRQGVEDEGKDAEKKKELVNKHTVCVCLSDSACKPCIG